MLYLMNRRINIAAVIVVALVAVITVAGMVVGQVDATAGNDVATIQTGTLPDNAGSATDSADRQIGGEVSPGQRIQSLSFEKNKPITDALRFLALRFQKNIVPTQSITGNITFTDLYNITFEEALQAIIGTNKYEIQENFVMVYTLEEYEKIKDDKRRMEYRVFTLFYITADEAQKLVVPLLSEDGQIAISSPAETGVPTGESISSDSSGGDNLAYQDTVVAMDYPEKIEEIEVLLKRLDVRPQQVLIEATILSATLTEDMDLGIDLSLAGGTSIAGLSTVAGWDQGGAPIEVSGLATAGANGLRLGIRSGNVSMFITALEQITDVTVMANPKILAVNKQLGQVYIGTKIGYREGDTETAAGGTEEGTVKFLDTGTKLSFRPYIGDDGYIRMQIHPKDSTGVLVAGIPQETSAEVATNIMVKDGQTIVIGGLFRESVSSTDKQVPLLGDIPLLGELFKGADDTTVRREVIVLLTPRIIDDTEVLEGDKRAEDIARKRVGARKALHWLGAGRLAEESYSKAIALYYEGDYEAAQRELNWTLNLRPTYYEALNLRDRIAQEHGVDSKETTERIMAEIIERQDAEIWIRY